MELLTASDRSMGGQFEQTSCFQPATLATYSPRRFGYHTSKTNGRTVFPALSTRYHAGGSLAQILETFHAYNAH